MNAISVLPMHPDSPHPHPRVIYAHFNPVMCDCKHSWLKRYLTNETFDVGKKVHMTHCIEPVWNKSIEIVNEPDMMFMCDTECPPADFTSNVIRQTDAINQILTQV